MMKDEILVVEDSRELLGVMRQGLRKAGYRVFAAASAEAGLASARRHGPDLVLLDIVLPGMDGLAFQRALRRESEVPVVFVTGRKTEVDRVVGLRLGADDYVTKPFSMEELLARVEAVLRRAAPRRRGQEREAPRFGRLKVDWDRHEIRVGGKAADLSAKEYGLLKVLIEARGKVLTREALLKEVWGYAQAEELATRAVDELVLRLRRKLSSERRRLVTVPGFGYRMDLK